MQPGQGGRSGGNVRNGARPLSPKPPKAKESRDAIFRRNSIWPCEGNAFSGWSAIRSGEDDDEKVGIAKKLSTEFALTPREINLALAHGTDLRGRRVAPQERFTRRPRSEA